MRHISKEELLFISNLMGCFRLIMILVFVRLYLRASTGADYYRAVTVMGISSATGIFDRMTTRRFDMAAESGELLDPLADKPTHRAILLCLWSCYPLILPLLVLFVLEEGFILVMGAVKLREDRRLSGARWFGKCCTALLFVVSFLLLLFPHMSLVTVNLLILLCAAAMFITLLLYIPVFRGV